jgi:hypothetical protein
LSALARFAFQACSFNHSDISPFDSLPLAHGRPFKWNQQLTVRHAEIKGVIDMPAASFCCVTFDGKLRLDTQEICLFVIALLTFESCGRNRPSKPRIDWFTLERKNTEHALMNASQWFTSDEPFQALNA